MDTPTTRSSHTEPVPRGGGWACLAGTATGCLAARAAGLRISLPVALGTLALTSLGWADDHVGVPAAPRLAAQVGVGLTAGAAAGHPVLGTGLAPVIVNMVNFMDGINGMTALTTAVWGASATVVGTRSENVAVTVLGAALGGSALGFLPHNLRSRRMFLGDVGSYFIGTSMALTTLLPGLPGPARLRLLAPLLPYALDTGATLIIRALRGENVMEAHRQHLYQRLANEAGWGHATVALAYAGAAAACATAAHRAVALDRARPMAARIG